VKVIFEVGVIHPTPENKALLVVQAEPLPIVEAIRVLAAVTLTVCPAGAVHEILDLPTVSGLQICTGFGEAEIEYVPPDGVPRQTVFVLDSHNA